MTKAELEKRVGVEMPEEFFRKVLDQAERKQRFLIERGDSIAAEDWYMEQLIEESFRSRSLSVFTMQLGIAMAEMEKEHSENRSALNS